MFNQKLLLALLVPAGLAMTGCRLDADRVSEVGDSDGMTMAIGALTSDSKLTGVAGCWNITQKGNQGLLILRQEGKKLTGYLEWAGNSDAVVSGEAFANSISLDFAYLANQGFLPTGYKLSVAADGRSMKGTGAGQSDASLQWTRCSGGCWSVTQGNLKGTRLSRLTRMFNLEAAYPGSPSPDLAKAYEMVIDAGGDYLTGNATTNAGKAATLVGMRVLCPAGAKATLEESAP